MKKTYYLTPFIAYPVLLFVVSFIFDKIKYSVNTSIWAVIIFIALFTLCSITISLFSKTKYKTDILIACCNLIAFIVAMIIFVLIEVKSDDHYQFRINTFYQPMYLISYFLIFISSLAASYERFRLKKAKSTNDIS